ncbi:putative membrane protein, partial [Yersinia pestis PY-52]
MQFASSIN